MQTDIGVRIRKMREAQDLSRDEVCRMAGLSPDRLAAFEPPDLDKWIRPDEA